MTTLTITVQTAEGALLFDGAADDPINGMAFGDIDPGSISGTGVTLLNGGANREFVGAGAGFEFDGDGPAAGTLFSMQELVLDPQAVVADFSWDTGVDLAQFAEALDQVAMGDESVLEAFTSAWIFVFVGNAGSDSFGSGDGNDTLFGGDGNDSMTGGAGSDSILGGTGADVLRGGSDGDALRGGGGGDEIRGGGGNDFQYAGPGNDSLYGGPGSDTSRGGPDADVIRSGGGNDTVYGGAGNDTLFGGPGMDVMTGGGDADRFVFNAAGAESADTLIDFITGVDKIVLDPAVFMMLAGGINTGNFISAVGAAALDSNDYLVYDTASGKLYYDADGSEDGAAAVFAQVAAGTPMAFSDFVLGT